MTIKKVKYNNGKVKIIFTKSTPSGEVEELTMESSDDPSAEFTMKFCNPEKGVFKAELFSMRLQKEAPDAEAK